MVAAVEKMAYAGETPWHGLGVRVSDDMSPEEMMKAAGLEWRVEKRPLFFQKGNGETAWMDGAYVSVRDSDDMALSYVGSKWKPTQNEQLFAFMKNFVAGGAKMHTAGSLWTGRYVWGLAELGREFTVGGKGKDRVGGYVLIALPHVLGKSMEIKFTSVRVVCWNTYSAALAGDARRRGVSEEEGHFKMSHSYNFDDAMQERAKACLGLAVKKFDEYKDAANLLAKKKCTEIEAHEIFCELIQFDPTKATKNKDGSIREPDFLKRLDRAFLEAPGQDFISADHTLWGVENALTWVIDHEYGEGADTRLKTAWFGEKANLKEEGHALLLKRAS